MCSSDLDLKNAPRFPTILPKVKDFVGGSAIVAHAYKNERDFLDYEFARAKVIPWGESAYADERYICTQVLFGQLFPGASNSLTSMADRLALDSSERDDRHGALLDADMTADALILMEHQLKHGEINRPAAHPLIAWQLTRRPRHFQLRGVRIEERSKERSSSLNSNFRITWARSDSEGWRRYGQQVDVEVGAHSEAC